MTGQDSWDRKTETGQLRHDSLLTGQVGMTARTGEPGQASQNGAAGSHQPGQDREEKMTGT